jgi:hypothetical protein
MEQFLQMITSIANDVIWYTYKGDEVCWNGKQYISLLSEGGFNSLDEIDKFWEDFYTAYNTA